MVTSIRYIFFLKEKSPAGFSTRICQNNSHSLATWEKIGSIFTYITFCSNNHMKNTITYQWIHQIYTESVCISRTDYFPLKVRRPGGCSRFVGGCARGVCVGNQIEWDEVVFCTLHASVCVCVCRSQGV